jgi:hypothetical protein
MYLHAQGIHTNGYERLADFLIRESAYMAESFAAQVDLSEDFLAKRAAADLHSPADDARLRELYRALEAEMASKATERRARTLARLAAGYRSMESPSKNSPTEHTVHFFYDLLLVQFLSEVTQGTPDREMSSACLDGLHWAYFGEPSKADVPTLLDLEATGERCYYRTFIQKTDLFRAAGFFQYSLEKRDVGDAIEGQAIMELLGSLMASLRKNLPSEIARILNPREDGR